MELQLHTINQDSPTGQIALSDEIFGRDFNEPLIHQVVTAYMAGARSGTKAQKTRAQVRGGGAKPWRQKGTGRARAGTSRSPIWRGGGRAFAASPRNYEQKINRKMYRGAVRSILSQLVREARLNLDHVLIVCSELSENLFLAARNIPCVGMVEVGAIDPAILVAYDKVIVTRQALSDLEELLK